LYENTFNLGEFLGEHITKFFTNLAQLKINNLTYILGSLISKYNCSGQMPLDIKHTQIK